MTNLEVHSTTQAFTNVAAGRPFVTPIELHERVMQQLVKGVAIFSFYKVSDGTQRHAIGTLNPALMPSRLLEIGEANVAAIFKAAATAKDILTKGESLTTDAAQSKIRDVEAWGKMAEDHLTKLNKPKKERKPNPSVQTFFDIQAQEWRTYNVDQLIYLIIPEGE